MYALAPDAPPCLVPLLLAPIPAGFPSPAEDYIDGILDLNTHLIPHPAATFMMRVKGDSMIGAGIRNGDMVIIDRSLSIANRQIVVVAIDGEHTMKQLVHKPDGAYLVPANPNYPSVKITEETTLEIFGVVVWVIHKT